DDAWRAGAEPQIHAYLGTVRAGHIRERATHVDDTRFDDDIRGDIAIAIAGERAAVVDDRVPVAVRLLGEGIWMYVVLGNAGLEQQLARDRRRPAGVHDLVLEGRQERGLGRDQCHGVMAIANVVVFAVEADAILLRGLPHDATKSGPLLLILN